MKGEFKNIKLKKTAYIEQKREDKLHYLIEHETLIVFDENMVVDEQATINRFKNEIKMIIRDNKHKSNNKGL